MPLKRRVIQTYGRHKFRTVKPDIWAKSPSVCSSGNDSSDFDFTPSTLRIRKPLTACSNVPKTQWNTVNSKKKPAQTRHFDGKENACVFETSSSSSSNGSCSPNYGKTTEFRENIIQETPPWAILNNKQTKLRNVSVKVTPASICGKDRNDLNHSQSIAASDHNKASSILQASNLSLGRQLSHSVADSSNCSSKTSSVDEEDELTQQQERETPVPKYSTSTPVVRINSQNGEFVTGRGRRRVNASQRIAQNISLSECQVFVEQLKLTPEQQKSARLSLSDVETSREVFVSNSKSVADSPEPMSSFHNHEHRERKNSSSSMLNEVFSESIESIEQIAKDSSVKTNSSANGRTTVKQSCTNTSSTLESNSLDSTEVGTNVSTLNKVSIPMIESDDEDIQDLSSTCQSTNSSDQISECVVALTKLQLSPFKVNGRLDKKRLCVRVSSSGQLSSHSSSLSSIHEEDVGVCITPPRNQSSHISFADVITPHTSLIKEPIDNELTAFEKLLLECEQDQPIKFKEYFKSSSLKRCVKIGEGVYGEVFRTINGYKQPVALKIIPINGDFEVNGEPQKSCQEILHEIVISKELSELAYGHEKMSNKWSTPNFISVHSVSLIQDKYPAHLIKEWLKWDKNNDSENDKPDIFPPNQLFLVFEFANGGTDLESIEFKSMAEALSVLKQVTISLAIAEASLEFEHRDLHWGNVLIKDTNDEELEYMLDGEARVIDSCGVHVSIIDFTLSRLKKDGVTVFCNLAEDESLFTGQGDYQFDIYRKMQELNCNEWETFTPATNIQWLHYLADKILNKKFPTRDRTASAALRRFYTKILQFQSAKEFVDSDENDFFLV